MGKTLMQFFVLAGLFFLLWFGLSSIDFVGRFHLDGLSKKTEKKVGEVLYESIAKTNKVIDDDSTTHMLDIIKYRMCRANGIDTSSIKIHLVQDEQINAFAIPGRHIIVYSGLINHCDSVSELCGVLSHEIAHIQLGHVMKRIVSEVGITLLSSLASNGNSQVAASIIKLLSSSAFERKQESDADAQGVQYLTKADIDPHGFAGFMQKMADLKPGTASAMEWISSHPDSRRRTVAITALISTGKHNYTPVLNDDEWRQLKDAADQ